MLGVRRMTRSPSSFAMMPEISMHGQYFKTTCYYVSHCVVLSWSIYRDNMLPCVVLSWSIHRDNMLPCVVLSWSIHRDKMLPRVVLSWSIYRDNMLLCVVLSCSINPTKNNYNMWSYLNHPTMWSYLQPPHMKIGSHVRAEDRITCGGWR